MNIKIKKTDRLTDKDFNGINDTIRPALFCAVARPPKQGLALNSAKNICHHKLHVI
jgi:hypothetical protein